MKNARFAVAAALVAVCLSGPANAALDQGAKAPEIATKGALAGKVFSFDLQKALKKGPVVLYFFPKAFTKGCTLEANAFAEAMDDFEAAGAQVVGLSADDLPTLQKFSTEECRDAFPVARASAATIRNYDVSFSPEGADTGLSDRTSYVIAPDGRIVMAYSDLDWRQHVSRSLAKVRALSGTK